MRRGVKVEASTNNEAEYAALMEGLFAVLNLKIQKLMIKGDSLLVVKQVLGSWQTKNPRLKGYLMKIKRLLSQFTAWNIQHIPRKSNQISHEEVPKGAGGRSDGSKD